MTQNIASKINIMENSCNQGKETPLLVTRVWSSSRVRDSLDNKKVHCYQVAREAQITNDFTLSFFFLECLQVLLHVLLL